MILILLQPNLGTALVIPPMVVSLLYVAQLPRRFFIAAIVLFATLATVVTVDMVRYYNFMTENNLSFRDDRGKFEPHSCCLSTITSAIASSPPLTPNASTPRASVGTKANR
jgi:rod shape determining protein RodA